MKKAISTFAIISLAVSLSAQDFTGIKICINPGHGGHDSDDRYMPETGFWESEGNLTKGLKLRDILEIHGAEIVMTRVTNNTADDLPLSQICQIANTNNVDYFHSIHSNGWNGQINYTLMLFRGWDNDPVFPDAMTMGAIMLDELYTANRTTGRYLRGDWSFYPNWGYQVGLGVLRNLNMPGTLSEGSFHDYIPESWRLQNLDYRRKESWAIAKSFVELYEKDPFDYKILAGLVRDSFERVDYFYISSLHDQSKPVNNVTVTLNPGNRVYNGDNMNNGFFLFDSLTPGDYDLLIEAEDYYSDSTTVTIQDNFYNFRDFYLVSKIPPKVVSTTPVEGDTAFPAWNPIVIEFSRPMDTSLTNSAVEISPVVPLDFNWNDTNMKMQIASDSLDYLTAYTLTITGEAQDAYGHLFDGNGDGVGGDEFVLNFSTGSEDMTAPKIESIYPKTSSSNIELHPIINIEFDEELDSSSVTDEIAILEYFEDHSIVPTTLKHFVVNERSVICLFPDEELVPNKVYVTRIYAGLTDLFGNIMTNIRSYSFRTCSETWQITSIDNFDSGLTTNWMDPQFSGSTVGQLDNYTSRSTETLIVNHLTQSTTAMKLRYGWDMNSSQWLIREYLGSGAPRNVTFDKNYVMQVYVFGDGSGNKLRFAVDDKYPNAATENHEVSPWHVIDWIGWKLVSWDMSSDGTGTWIGDGNLDGTLRFDSIQLTYNSEDPDVPNIGQFYFDDLRIVTFEPVGIEPSHETLPESYTLEQNYPNP
ncbi:MAG: Ig-like domain-containing protein, partial [Candidatus Marinimicrobia bacterium]|nr:Ig-like domain-containing protein [Candidatus Neomarinimicrobiota bacterium]